METDGRKAWPTAVLVLALLGYPVGSEMYKAHDRSVHEARAREVLSGNFKSVELWANGAFEGKGEKRITISDSKEVEDLLHSISLKAKEPCGCKHNNAAAFSKADGTRVNVSFCDHCFSMGGPEGEFDMPQAFYHRAMILLKGE